MEDTEEKESELTTVRLKSFCVSTNEPEDFIEKLEELCRTCSNQEDFFFNFSFED